MLEGVKSNKGTGSDRMVWIDACRGLAMIFVLLGHNNPPFIRFIYGFHIPLFYLLSGYLYKPGYKQPGFKKIVGNIIGRFFIPYYVLCFINLFLHGAILVIATNTWLNVPQILDYIKGILLVDYKFDMPDCSPLWFLFSMGLVRILFWVIRKIKDIGIRLTIYTAGSIFWYIVWDDFRVDGKVMLPFAIHTVWIGLIFMEIGYLIKQYGFIEKAAARSGRFKAAIVLNGLLVGFAGIALNRVEPRVDISYGCVGSIPLMFLGALGVSGSIMCLFRFYKDKKWLKPLAYIGKHTIFLMAFDWFSNTLGGQILENFLKDWNWGVSFVTRIILLAAMLALWQLILKHVPEGKAKKALDI